MGRSKVTHITGVEEQEYKGLIPDLEIEGIYASNDTDAIKKVISNLRNKFNTLTDEEIVAEFGLLVYLADAIKRGY